MSRAALIGACYGAMNQGAALGTDGVEDGVPAAWISLLNNGEAVLDFAKKLVEIRARLMGART